MAVFGLSGVGEKKYLMKNSNMKEHFHTIRTKRNEKKKTLKCSKKEKLIPCSSCVNTKSTYL